jgi:hypothetical protein
MLAAGEPAGQFHWHLLAHGWMRYQHLLQQAPQHMAAELQEGAAA